MKTFLLIGGACLALAGAPALAQEHSTTATVEHSDGSITTTTSTVKRDPGGAAPGALGGAAAGAVVAGPVGAVIGAVAGAAVGHSVAPPERVRTYVTTRTAPADTVAYKGDIVVGHAIDGDVTWSTVPDEPKYSWAYLNGKRVVIDNDTHRVAAVY